MIVLDFDEISLTTSWADFVIPIGTQSIAFQNPTGSGETMYINDAESDTGYWPIAEGEKEVIEEQELSGQTYKVKASGACTMYRRIIKRADS